MTTRLAGSSTPSCPSTRAAAGGAGNPENPGGYKTAYLWEEVWSGTASWTSWRASSTCRSRRSSVGGKKVQARDDDLPALPPARRACAGWWPTPASAAPGTTTWSSTRPAAARATPSPGWPTGWPACTTTRTRRSSTRSSSSPTGWCSTSSCRTRSTSSSTSRAWCRRSTRDSTPAGRGAGGRRADRHHHAAEVPLRHREDRRAARCAGTPSSSTRRTARRRGEAATELKGVLAGAAIKEEARAKAEEEGSARLRGRDPQGDGQARPAAEPQLLRLHGHAQVQDAGGLRRAGRGRQAAALPPLHHAPGDRGGLHPRRAAELHDLQDVLPAGQGDRGRSQGGQAQGGAGAGPLHEPAPAQHRPEDRGHGRALPRTSRGTRSAAGPRRWWSPSSRLHAVRYKQAFDKYIAEKGYTDIKTLVAFSGTVDRSRTCPASTYTEVGHEQRHPGEGAAGAVRRPTSTRC